MTEPMKPETPVSAMRIGSRSLFVVRCSWIQLAEFTIIARGDRWQHWVDFNHGQRATNHEQPTTPLTDPLESVALTTPLLTKIDLHTHILPETWPDLRERYGYGGWVRLEHYKPCCARMMIDDTSFREITHNCWDPQPRIEECNKTGVRMQVLSTVPVMFSYWARPGDALDLAMILNDHIAGVCSRHPDRFLGLGSVPMQLPRLAVQELERCVNDLGLRGVQIGTHVNEWNLDEPHVFEVLQAASDLGAAVFVHPWDMLGQDRMQKYWMPWLVGMPAETALAICSVI